jgi:hypothetical protein
MPLFRRRPLLRAAAIGGGAYAYGKHRERAQTEQQEDAYAQGQEDAPAPAASASSGITSEDTQRLAELGKLHEQGVLTDAEFSAEKAKILGIG